MIPVAKQIGLFKPTEIENALIAFFVSIVQSLVDQQLAS